jgi:hypothetical protein
LGVGVRYVIERTEFASGETSVTICIAVRGIQREKMIKRQREECDRQRGKPVRRGDY